MPKWLNLPNLFTLLRVVLTPFVIKEILDGRHMLALELFAIAAFTDILDGAAARRFGVVTPTGAYLDPIADKCLLSGVFLALAVARIVPVVARRDRLRTRSADPGRSRRCPVVYLGPAFPARASGGRSRRLSRF